VKPSLILFLVLLAALAAARFCHNGILWAEEGLPLAAAAQMQQGQALYRDIWFDKPPLLPAVYLLWGARAGWPLRLAGALYDLLACGLAFLLARDLWGRREAHVAAALLGFFLIFDIPSAVTPLAADLLMLAPHLAAVWLAARGRAWWAGVAAGVAFLINPKGLIVTVVCFLWNPAAVIPLGLGFAAANGLAVLALWQTGALGPYYDQVWKWGRIYAGQTFVADPLRNALARTGNWFGFHATLAIAAGYAWWREPRRDVRLRWLGWILLSLVAVAAGLRFFPRYFFQLLPAMVLLGARGLCLMPRRQAAMVALVLAVPLVRFGPRYALLAAGRSETWTDTAMDRDSRAAAARVAAVSRPGDTVFVWGFRPELYVYTGLPAAVRFLDSQPLTGVPADRHLTQSQPVDPASAREHRAELMRTRPTFVLDGLGLYNPALAIGAYADLAPWLAAYREIARTGQTVILRRTE
jgi:hypothetical protein